MLNSVKYATGILLSQIFFISLQCEKQTTRLISITFYKYRERYFKLFYLLFIIYPSFVRENGSEGF